MSQDFLGGVGRGGHHMLYLEQNHMGLMALEIRSLSLEDGISSKPQRLLVCSALSAIIWDRVWVLG